MNKLYRSYPTPAPTAEPLGPAAGAWEHTTGIERAACTKAGHGRPIIGYKLTVANQKTLHTICEACGQQIEGRNIGKTEGRSLADGYGQTQILCFQNNLILREPETKTCERCSSQGYGYHTHHWAPRHLFGDDCDTWPTSILCPTCHAEWHSKVTPRMAQAKS